MGIVFRQSARNTLVTYFGFAIGAINTLFLYTRFLTDEYFGLVGVILSTATLLMPVMAFGVPNTLIKFYSRFNNDESSYFLGSMLFFPLIMILPLGLLSYLANEAIGAFLAHKNLIVKGYVWHIFLIGMAMAYFEVFYAWSKVHMRSVFGNFMKEVFVRIGVTLLLLLLYAEIIDVSFFLNALAGLYILRTLLMKLVAFSLEFPRLRIGGHLVTREILTYSLLIILGGSTAIILLEIDRFMINQFIQIENVAYYTVGIFIATVVAVPSRAMHQITYPLTAEILNTGDNDALKKLYTKSSLTLFIVAGMIFLLIMLNLPDLYPFLPESYRGGYLVVFLIGLSRVFDAILGNNNAILFNSRYYRAVLLMGVLLALATIVLNLIFIPLYQTAGAAMATCIAVFLYNIAKLVFVWIKFEISPFSNNTIRVLGLLIFIGVLFHALQFTFHPILNIILKSALMVIMYAGVLYRFRISEDINGIVSRWFRK
ncbi:lipopolysaccharide biosynthesis protein [Lentiprolixibacter aurantiacus]|uniref:Polysaccharide biosynthesis C-terminal domain-containing protein n=1 Tax=Lentiprolixibacter aurantiacus TaxID=2993939 RepID=A0AAE3SNC3_9FLAO|nr:polysaccharide biosynthesis C-terminal domain-containing protein [Lentiprolixibacter aurantiacus]MCX2719474.1 polysaccharide biosynthesis C-terminal domain-containing protein [Lentiprolixibacter aurantiacus]